MSEPLSLFLACSFAGDKVGADGYGSDQGISDWDLAQIVRDTIESESQQRIHVKITKDPFDKYISSKVSEELAEADLMLCLFTKRTPIPNSALWITSTFALSEGAAYYAQLSSENETHDRLFAIVEEGVDTSQLGMAFPPGSKAMPRFRRGDIAGLKQEVRRIVDHVLGSSTTPREDREYLSLDKTVTILRNGKVQVETRHRYRFTTPTRKVVIPHTIWRVSRPLPSFNALVSRDTTDYMLRWLACGDHSRRNKCKLQIRSRNNIAQHHEYRFEIEATGTEFQPGDELQYAIVWEYPQAFSRDSEFLNSVGLRCGDRGVAQQATLTIQFERDLDEPDRLLEEPPTVWLTNVTEFRAGDEPEDFWHKSPSWHKLATLTPCNRQSSLRYEVYRWTKQNFLGMAKVTFAPHLNYFLPSLTQRSNNLGNSTA